jgi:hypothetical protein
MLRIYCHTEFTGACIKLFYCQLLGAGCATKKNFTIFAESANVKGRISVCHKFNDRKVLKCLFCSQQTYAAHHFKTVVFHDTWYMHRHVFLLNSKVINFDFKFGVSFLHKTSLIHNSSISRISALDSIYDCQYSISRNLVLTSLLLYWNFKFLCVLL